MGYGNVAPAPEISAACAAARAIRAAAATSARLAWNRIMFRSPRLLEFFTEAIRPGREPNCRSRALDDSCVTISLHTLTSGPVGRRGANESGAGALRIAVTGAGRLIASPRGAYKRPRPIPCGCPRAKP